MTPFVKVKKWAQRAGCCGGHKHVDKWTKRRANTRIRRLMKSYDE